MGRFRRSVLAVALFASLLAARGTPQGTFEVAADVNLNAFAMAAIAARYEFAGPITADVLRVIDGDTFTVRAHIWIGQELTTNVRLLGVNAPELSGHCEEERALAEAARRFLAARLEGRSVTLRDIALDKYGGRVVARVEDSAGDIAAALLAARLVVPYDGGRRGSWCE
jgi:micrococcal nuclease